MTPNNRITADRLKYYLDVVNSRPDKIPIWPLIQHLKAEREHSAQQEKRIAELEKQAAAAEVYLDSMMEHTPTCSDFL